MIGRNVWIATGATIIGGVTVGENSVVGSHDGIDDCMTNKVCNSVGLAGNFPLFRTIKYICPAATP